jgi:hypothetical protein
MSQPLVSSAPRSIPQRWCDHSGDSVRRLASVDGLVMSRNRVASVTCSDVWHSSSVELVSAGDYDPFDSVTLTRLRHESSEPTNQVVI